jgi:peroxiredoxin
MKKTIAFTVLGIMLSYAIWQAISNVKVETGVEMGNKAPDFELQQVNGDPIQLSSLEGKKVLVNFWASWCGPCLEEMPEMEKLHNESNGDYVVLAVNMTVTEKNLQTAKDFVNEHNFSFPTLLDVSNKTSSTYEVLSLPVSYFIDTEGIIRHKFVGAMDLEYMKENLNKLN